MSHNPALSGGCRSEMRPARGAFALLPILGFALAGCGDNGATAPAEEMSPGTAEVTLTGDVAMSVEGQAFFGSVPDAQNGVATGLHGHIVTMALGDGSGSGTGLYLFHLSNQASFPEGSFSLIDTFSEEAQADEEAALQEGFALIYVLHLSDGSPALIQSVSGVVTLSRSNDGNLLGSFQGTAAGESYSTVDGSSEQLQVDISGDFHAVSSAVELPI